MITAGHLFLRPETGCPSRPQKRDTEQREITRAHLSTRNLVDDGDASFLMDVFLFFLAVFFLGLYLRGKGQQQPTARRVAVVNRPQDHSRESASKATTSDETMQPRQVHSSFGDGIFEVGVDVAPGTYRALGEESNAIMWARLSGFSGSGVLATGCVRGPCIVTILPTDRGFESHFSGGWIRID